LYLNFRRRTLEKKRRRNKPRGRKDKKSLNGGGKNRIYGDGYIGRKKRRDGGIMQMNSVMGKQQVGMGGSLERKALAQALIHSLKTKKRVYQLVVGQG